MPNNPNSMRKLVLLLPLLLSACGNQLSSANTTAAADAPTKLELDSPDHAVKTWWKTRDAIAAHANAACPGVNQMRMDSNGFKDGSSITTGAARATFEEKPQCTLRTYSREITEVKVESETRAIVLAKIKATTPIPPDATPDDRDLKYRAEGFPYKYVLEKVGKDWKIAQVYSYKTYGDGDPWEATFAEKPKPYVHSLIYGPQ